ncbi:MAG: agmatine deiminase family protein [Pseudomonadota bacterium]
MIANCHSVPPEWAPQAALWVGWPHLRDEWGDAFDQARLEIAAFVRAAARFQPVSIACGSEDARKSAKSTLSDLDGNVTFEAIPTGDIWLRDTGPIVAIDGAGEPRALTFRFNGWGGKYVMPGDTETSAAMAMRAGLPIIAHDFVLEGGAIDVDGAGRLLTTRQCLLNPNRNSGWTGAEVEAALHSAFDIDEIVWLDQGLIGDHTDGHIDNLARFVGPGHVLCQRPSGVDDPQAAVLMAAETLLRASGLKVTTLPSPGRIVGYDGETLPASHMNFTLINGAVMLPFYEPVFSDEAAAVLSTLFPDREIVSCAATAILHGGGSLHCMTREIPQIGPVAVT